MSVAKIWPIISHNLEAVQDRSKLITNRKSHMGFRLVPNRWPWMTLNGVIAIILRYFAEFGSFRGQLRKSGWLAIDRFFSREMSWSTPTKHDGRAVLFAVAELLVTNWRTRNWLSSQDDGAELCTKFPVCTVGAWKSAHCNTCSDDDGVQTATSRIQRVPDGLLAHERHSEAGEQCILNSTN